ncbi:unnamed protein product [Urochloa humidicola]
MGLTNLGVAAVGWSISTAGWVMSPITTKVLQEGFALLGFDESEKLWDLEARVLPRLALMMERAERIPPERRVRVEQWAARLRSAIYDAEDVVDVTDYHRLERKANPQSIIQLSIGRMHQIVKGKGTKLRRILEKLEKIIVEGSQFLPELTGAINNNYDAINPTNQAVKVVTTSSALPDVVFGRDNECAEIVRMLREEPDDASSHANQCYSVIGIYGVAESGKTTLAQYVCNYEKSAPYFSLIMWINVSQALNIGKVYEEMLESATGKPSSNFNNLDILERKLEIELTGKKILLILDDIWPDKSVNGQNLKRLLSPLKSVQRGSKVLTTSRFKDAATFLGAQILIPILDMDERDFFDMFIHYALDGANLNDRELDEFLMVGEEILKNLKGLPLGATVVAARLRKQLDLNFWRRVADEKLFTGTMDSLCWSFKHLNDKVQRCFAYCSMFPPHTWFKRDELVNLWISEGFVSTRAGEDVEDVGLQYFDELVSCSFLKNEENGMFHMHDLLHELAAEVSGTDCLRLEDGETINLPLGDIRHLYVDLYDPMEALESICKMKKLRTLITSPNGLGFTEQALDGILKKLRNLRVLKVKVRGDGMIPSSVCHLQHLRYLSIHKSKRGDIDLPRKFDRLYHLQIIEFTRKCTVSCSSVKNMHNLISLRHICSSLGPPYIPMEPSLHFPEIGKITSLRTLGHFSVRKEKGYELKQLGCLNSLHASLKISGLENIESRDVALEAKLLNKKFLTELALVWHEHHGYHLGSQANILEGLQPPPLLAKLQISRYCDSKYPSWLSEDQDSLRSLQCLELELCLELEVLPEITEHLVHLRELILRTLPKLKRLPILPPNLKKLEISGCEALLLTCAEDMEPVKSMFIERAGQTVPPLNISDCGEICRFADDQPERFQEILCDIIGNQNTSPGMLSSIIPFICGQTEDADCNLVLPTALEDLTVAGCIVTDTILNNWLGSSASLVGLKLDGIPFLTKLSSEAINILSKLRRLWICDCLHFTTIEGINELKMKEVLELSISGCPNLMLLGEDEKMQAIGSICIDDLTIVRKLLSTEACSSQKYLEIWCSKELGDEGILLQFTALNVLWFEDCSMDVLPGNLKFLTSLKRLVLNGCKNILSLPTLPSALQYFVACGCNKRFVESCEKYDHPNWEKIQHVPLRLVSTDNIWILSPGNGGSVNL